MCRKLWNVWWVLKKQRVTVEGKPLSVLRRGRGGASSMVTLWLWMFCSFSIRLCSISAVLDPKQSSGELSLLTNQEGHQRRPGSDWDLTCKWTFTISDSKLQTHTMLPQMWMSAGRCKTTNFFNKVKQLRNELFLLFYTLLFAEWCKVLLSCQLYFQA